jgi:hypothetical protein
VGNTSQINAYDIELLAAFLVDMDGDDHDESELDEKLMEEWGIDLDYFTSLIRKLSSTLDMAISPLTEEPYIGFATSGFWLAKMRFPTFINQVLVWMSAESLNDEKSNAFERTITSNGKPEYKLVLMRADQEYKLLDKEVTNA